MVWHVRGTLLPSLGRYGVTRPAYRGLKQGWVPMVNAGGADWRPGGSALPVSEFVTRHGWDQNDAEITFLSWYQKRNGPGALWGWNTTDPPTTRIQHAVDTSILSYHKDALGNETWRRPNVDGPDRWLTRKIGGPWYWAAFAVKSEPPGTDGWSWVRINGLPALQTRAPQIGGGLAAPTMTFSFWNGAYYADTMLFNRVLSIEEMDDILYGGIDPRTLSNLVAWWPGQDAPASDIVEDISGNNWHLLPPGGAASIGRVGGPQRFIQG